MTKLKNFAYMGAIALMGTVGFTACSSDDELAAGPDPIVSGETVKTQFAINIPHATGTRMSGTTTQAGTGATFRGMTDIRLVPFDLATTPSTVTSPVEATTTFNYNAIQLANINTSDLKETSKAKVYNDVDIPLGTNAFLFYGKAITNTTETGFDAEQINGVLNPSYMSGTGGFTTGAEVSTINFNLQSILNGKTVTDEQEVLLGILDAVAGATGRESTKWSSVTKENDAVFYQYFQDFTSLKAGSANSIRLALQDLYNAMKSPRVDDYKGLKTAICNAIEGTSNSNFTVIGSAEPYTLEYATGVTAKEYPGDLNLPDGAVQVDYNSETGKFEYLTTSGTDNTGLNVTSVNNYVYPASLYYWTNTSLKTSTTSEETNYANNPWNSGTGNVIDTYYDNNWEVEADTRSVALTQTINYGVGRFDVYAKFADVEIPDADDESVTLPTNGFQLTGVLVGGQKNVGWNFEPLAGSQTEYTIYDAAVAADTYVKRGNLPSTPQNYTLVLETAGGDASNAETVNFALEFVNNSNEAFRGTDGIIPVGGKFYLVGQIKSETSGDYTKVFKQDTYTTANVTINSLEHAYNGIPDLRSPKLELGLSVDITWTQGLTQDVVIL